MHVSLAASGSKLALATGRALRTYALGSEQPLEEPRREEESELTALSLSPRGEYLLTGTASGSVALWETGKQGGPAFRFRLHSAPTTALAWDASESFFASVGADGSVQLHAIDGLSRGGFRAQSPITAVTFVLGGCLLAGDETGQIWFWPPFDETPTLRLRFDGAICALEGGTEGPLTAVSTLRGELHLVASSGKGSGTSPSPPLHLAAPARRLRLTSSVTPQLLVATGNAVERHVVRPAWQRINRREFDFAPLDLAERPDGTLLAVGIHPRCARFAQADTLCELPWP